MAWRNFFPSLVTSALWRLPARISLHVSESRPDNLYASSCSGLLIGVATNSFCAGPRKRMKCPWKELLVSPPITSLQILGPLFKRQRRRICNTTKLISILALTWFVKDCTEDPRHLLIATLFFLRCSHVKLESKDEKPFQSMINPCTVTECVS